MSRKGVLLILDGYGEGKSDQYNAVINAKTPFLDKIKAKSHSLLKTDGEAVGIFEGELGGSEVGHTTIGAGRIVPSTAKAIHDDMLLGKLKDNKVLVSAFEFLKEKGGNLHLWGLCSDKNIHSDINTA
ncbi:MAG: 2,3-bisphosphoglycerate-independent phosphoglycerate mutase, partial [Clostridia bacterium]|nr:2,3-bisphosphoglycerate-independent phosphoglycerate mutase [Clostridia bacterium]